MTRPPRLTLTVQYAVREYAALKARLPRATLARWIKSALLRPAALTLRFVDQEEGWRLNRVYRGTDQATNVLAFVYTEPSDAHVISDIVLCCPVIEREAVEQNKALDAHYAHLVIHGVLHAQGYRHDDPDNAREMEAFETERLVALGFADPYTDPDRN